jgi:hypothetical protein
VSHPPRKEERHDEAPPPSRGTTVTAQGETQSPKARQPFERDESADSQAADSASNREMGQIAHEAQVSGQQDTSRAKEADATYHRLQQESEPAPQDKVNQNQRGDAAGRGRGRGHEPGNEPGNEPGR